jgi:HD-GYP domain-containing protein (c-di-GMP phosphodiesterase class II)
MALFDPLMRPTPASIVLAELLRICAPPLAARLARVGLMSERLALRLGRDEAEAREIGRAGSLHDIGMAFVPEELLDKAGLLSVRERELVHRRASSGRQLLEMAGDRGCALAATVSLQHRERWDGAGEPLGLAGEEICLAARIVALCAAYEAARNPRPGREALDHDCALALLVENDGQGGAAAFDPALVAAFVRHGADFQGIAEA